MESKLECSELEKLNLAMRYRIVLSYAFGMFFGKRDMDKHAHIIIIRHAMIEIKCFYFGILRLKTKINKSNPKVTLGV